LIYKKQKDAQIKGPGIGEVFLAMRRFLPDFKDLKVMQK